MADGGAGWRRTNGEKLQKSGKNGELRRVWYFLPQSRPAEARNGEPSDTVSHGSRKEGVNHERDGEK
jgi:hypothetical protein